jgi:S-adenosylmethionine:tRNA ribosyltransferase-isomerase
MDHIPDIRINDYQYDLPPERIAQFPLAERDASRLLVYQDGGISEDTFHNLPLHLPEGSLLIYNKTRVIQARIQFQKDSGALIEVFCLEPLKPTREIQLAFEQRSGVVWKCLVGNSKKWKSGELQHRFQLDGMDITLKANRLEKANGYSHILFEWEPALKSFSEILQAAGLMPLPPYMKRESQESDKVRYQTIYARAEGSVAAPTAGLHFTPGVFDALGQKQIERKEVTLHVGAGTFKPVTSEQVSGHEMHTEQVRISRETVEALLHHGNKPIIAVGTTTLRTLESLYWHGVKCIVDNSDPQNLNIRQWDPYKPEYKLSISLEEALNKLLTRMGEEGLEEIAGQTQLMIVPGYLVKVPDILLTNFHMPGSTLLLLVSAFIGEGWKEAYRYALDNDFRFLSYGDSCLFFRKGLRHV